MTILILRAAAIRRSSEVVDEISLGTLREVTRVVRPRHFGILQLTDAQRALRSSLLGIAEYLAGAGSR